MEYSATLLLTLILISSIICGILIVICSILVFKYWYKYRRGRISVRGGQPGHSTNYEQRSGTEIKVNENNCPLIPNINASSRQTTNNANYSINLDCPSTNRNQDKDSLLNSEVVEENGSHLSVLQSPNRRFSDNSPYKDGKLGPQTRPRSVSQIVTCHSIKGEPNKTSNPISVVDSYRKNSFHLRPFDLASSNKTKISHSMEFINHNKASYDQVDERKVHSFDCDFIRLNSKSQNVFQRDQEKSKELSKSLMSFLQKLSKVKTKNVDDKKKSPSKSGQILKHVNNAELFIDLDFAYTCPFQISKNMKNNLPKNGSLESSIYISSFDSSEMNEAFLAVSREIHNSCDSDLCFKSATVKRKQFYKEKIKPNSTATQYIQCSSAKQSIERDYSIDEKSSTIFKEFLRNDPNLDKNIMEENVRKRLRSERGYSHHNSQNRKRSKARVIESFKSASFTDGDSHPQTNIHTNSIESQIDAVNRSPSPLPMIILSSDNQF